MPSYQKLSSLRNRLPDVPIMALTATAVPKVQEDVIVSLSLQNPLVLKSSFNRPNIYYEVRYKDLMDDPYSDLCDFIKSCGDICAIVYCLERTTCDDLAVHLTKKGISCAAYHAGLNCKLRSSVLDSWISSKTQVVVATVAFGMGIDRKDVRVVCHFNIPKSMEGFYQESGRAGRDQLPSRSLLYYGSDDRRKMEFILTKTRKKTNSLSKEEGSSKKSLADFHQMIGYCEDSGCRRKKILESFGEQVTASLCAKSCDACRHPSLVSKCLKEFATATTFHSRNRSPQVYISSASDFADKQFSEFWNRNDEASESEEDISDSDDPFEIEKNIAHSSKYSAGRLTDRIESLQRAEEKYYESKNNSEKQSDKVDKKTISETLRNSGRQRLLKAMEQTQHRFDDLQIDFCACAETLENECYKKYSKSGKSFYLSQMASTVRWLSTATLNDLRTRVDTVDCAKSVVSPEPCCESPSLNQVDSSTHEENTRLGIKPDIPISGTITTPPVLSFAQFINAAKTAERKSLSSEGKRVFQGDGSSMEKKTKF